MSMQDTLADMFTRIRNGLAVAKPAVNCPHTTIKEAILKVLQQQGYIQGYDIDTSGTHKGLVIKLKYFNGAPVINRIQRVSRSSLRVYRSADALQEVKNKLGISIVTPSRGVMTGREAKNKKLGGEVICHVD